MSTVPGNGKSTGGGNDETLALPSNVTPLDSALAQTITGTNTKSAAATSDSDAVFARSLATLPNYEIQNKLGQGGMGAVYRARQRTLNRTVAIKVLPQHLCNNSMYVARLNREAIALAKLNHPNVITCFDLGEHEGMRYVVMEFVEGESLSNLIDRRKTIPQSEALYYLKQAVLGLDYSNALGIIHRDIKPDNMLLAKSVVSGTSVRMASGYTLKIADLGLAVVKNDATENTRLTVEGSTLGSPHYMSPEQTVGELDVDFRTDIYALGITLYHMLTGVLPYQANTIGAVLAKKLSETIVDPREHNPEISPSVSLLIHKMTARKKEDRYASYGDLLRDIEAIEQKRSIEARVLAENKSSILLSSDTLTKLKLPQTQIAETPQATKSNASLLIAGAAVLVVLGVIGLLAPRPGNESPLKVDKDKPVAAVATHQGAVEPPVKPPLPEKIESTPQIFAPLDLIEERSIKGWRYKGEAKDFGFQEGSLFLQSFKNWNVAERDLPGSEYTVRGLLQTPTGADDCEFRLGFSDKEYLAFGIRLPADVKNVTAYVERREKSSDKVLEVCATRGDLIADDWQDLKINIWDRQATCFVGTKFLVSAEMNDAQSKSKLIQLAVRSGIVQVRNLEASPRPVGK